MTDQLAPAVVADNAGQVATPTESQPWYSSIQDEGLRGFAELKGWKDPGAAIDSYRNLEKLRGVPENELIRIPKAEDAESWQQVYSRLGRPESPDLYELPIPEGDDGAFAKTAAEWMHKAGLTKGQAQQIAEMNNQFLAEQVQAFEAEKASSQAREIEELRSEWGMAYDQNTEIARRGAQQFGIEPEMLEKIEDAIGTKALLTMFHNIGSKVGEHKMVQGQGDGFKLSPAAAQERIAQLKGDKEWAGKYLAGGANEKAEFERLMRMAYPS